MFAAILKYPKAFARVANFCVDNRLMTSQAAVETQAAAASPSERSTAEIPAAAALAKNLVAGFGDHDRFLELDEATLWMFQRGFDRHHHAGLKRQPRVGIVIGDRPRRRQARRLVADEAHAVGEEFHVVAQLRLLQSFFRRRVNLA